MAYLILGQTCRHKSGALETPDAMLVVVAVCYEIAAHAILWISGPVSTRPDTQDLLHRIQLLLLACSKIPKSLKLAILFQEGARAIPFQEPNTAHDSNTVEVGDGSEAMRNGNNGVTGKVNVHKIPCELL